MKITQAELRKGMVVKCPWSQFGDDPEMTGTVTKVDRKVAWVVWHGNGTVTPAGAESGFTRNGTEVDIAFVAQLESGEVTIWPAE